MDKLSMLSAAMAVTDEEVSAAIKDYDRANSRLIEAKRKHSQAARAFSIHWQEQEHRAAVAQKSTEYQF